ncbi:hypothetical protein RhiJN_07868 [Ceratobasidium sp. AG-Ba]|nr:hypothetical protein RhiJN_07868 [Ceratobasidium sp. AG-Ba]
MPRYATPETRAQINELRHQGMSFRKIGPLVNVHPTTASRIYERNCKTRSLTSVAAKSGRPRILSDSDAKFAALSLARGHTYNAVRDVVPETVCQKNTEFLLRLRQNSGMPEQETEQESVWGASFRPRNRLFWHPAGIRQFLPLAAAKQISEPTATQIEIHRKMRINRRFRMV